MGTPPLSAQETSCGRSWILLFSLLTAPSSEPAGLPRQPAHPGATSGLTLPQTRDRSFSVARVMLTLARCVPRRLFLAVCHDLCLNCLWNTRNDAVLRRNTERPRNAPISIFMGASAHSVALRFAPTLELTSRGSQVRVLHRPPWNPTHALVAGLTPGFWIRKPGAAQSSRRIQFAAGADRCTLDAPRSAELR